MADYAYYSEIKKLEFYVLGTEEDYLDSAVSVINKELFKGELPVAGGCYDANMGTTEYGWRCQKCLGQYLPGALWKFRPTLPGQKSFVSRKHFEVVKNYLFKMRPITLHKRC